MDVEIGNKSSGSGFATVQPADPEAKPEVMEPKDSGEVKEPKGDVAKVKEPEQEVAKPKETEEPKTSPTETGATMWECVPSHCHL